MTVRRACVSSGKPERIPVVTLHRSGGAESSAARVRPTYRGISPSYRRFGSCHLEAVRSHLWQLTTEASHAPGLARLHGAVGRLGRRGDTGNREASAK